MFLCYNINIEQKFEEEYIMKRANQIPQEKVNNFIERINNLTDEQFTQYINLLYQSGLISEDSDQKCLHQD